ncbi:MAG: type II toxin-antitoxin system Phd/YefM family antitoxin [Candidatus Omnitrophota bacterium]|nr:type II toxin-antitoxin system Phd/YefM family antitoxin [Candidatus Omnitrophota bacterium]
MKFVTVRDLRNKSAQIRQYLSKEKEIVLTSNGKPFAIVTSASEENLEKSLIMMRRIRAENAVNSIQKDSLEKGKDRISMEEINAEISAVRKARK